MFNNPCKLYLSASHLYFKLIPAPAIPNFKKLLMGLTVKKSFSSIYLYPNERKISLAMASSFRDDPGL